MKTKGELIYNFTDAESGQIASVYFNDPSIKYGNYGRNHAAGKYRAEEHLFIFLLHCR